MKKSRMMIGVLLAVLCLCSGCYYNFGYKVMGEDYLSCGIYDVDIQFSRGDDWEKIVTESDFQFGGVKTVCYDGGIEDDYEIDYQEYGTYPCISTSNGIAPLAMEFARQHLKMSDEDVNSFIYDPVGDVLPDLWEDIHVSAELPSRYDENDESDLPYKMDEDQSVDLVLDMNPTEEVATEIKRDGIPLISKPVCYDALVFFTHKENPVESLTVQQIQDIYTGKIRNWFLVSGKIGAIKAYQWDFWVDHQRFMEESVMRKKQMATPPMLTTGHKKYDFVFVEEYQDDLFGIGYISQFYYNLLYDNRDTKVLCVDGVTPSKENIQSGAYPFVNTYFGTIRENEQEADGGKFLEWILSEEGQACVSQAGYVPLK